MFSLGCKVDVLAELLLPSKQLFMLESYITSCLKLIGSLLKVIRGKVPVISKIQCVPDAYRMECGLLTSDSGPALL